MFNYGEPTIDIKNYEYDFIPDIILTDGYNYEAFALGSRIQNEAKSYDEALNIMQEYVIPVSCLDKNSDDMDLDI